MYPREWLFLFFFSATEFLNISFANTMCSVRKGGKTMRAEERQGYRTLLLKKLEELSATIGKTESVVPAAGDRHGDLADQANSEIEAELQIRLHQTDGPLMRAIEAALVRLKNDAFGKCITCGKPISKARLKASPDASLHRLQGDPPCSKIDYVQACEMEDPQ